MIFPRKWKHKENGKECRVMPWWECPEPVLSDDDIGTEQTEGRKFKIGSLVQIGWLIENEHGMFFGVGPRAAESFDDVGEWPKPATPEKEPSPGEDRRG